MEEGGYRIVEDSQLEQPKTGSKLRVFKNIQYFFNIFSNIVHLLLRVLGSFNY